MACPEAGCDRSAFGDPDAVRGLAERIRAAAGRLAHPVTFMEVCGTHTNAIAASGLRRLLPENIRLVAGPGCPVCVTPVPYMDRAEALAMRPHTAVCTFGDLLRVPSSHGSLEQVSARGGDVRVVYSPRDAVEIARQNPNLTVVFLGVGFETTAPTVAAAIHEAEATGVKNFKVLSGHKVMPPPLRALASDAEVKVDGFICPGHVSVITGWRAFSFIPGEYGLASVVAGFMPADVMLGVQDLVRQVVEGKPETVNLYSRFVTPDGNPTAKALVERYFLPQDQSWRGFGTIPESGLGIRPEYAHRDAGLVDVKVCEPAEPEGCRCGEVLKGSLDPPGCPLFGRECTYEHPVGACMVSGEGTCAAWYRHERTVRGGSP
jgi:hydrogenase expression/formation protein HypD